MDYLVGKGSADADLGVGEEGVGRDRQVFRRRALPDAAGRVVDRAMAGAEPAAELAGLVERNAAEMGADADHDQPRVVALLDARGFGAEDFARSHPGGSLGRRLLTRMRDVMRSGERVPKAPVDASLLQALEEMTKKGMGMTAVVDADDRPVGVFTDGDLRRMFERVQDFTQVAIRDVMHAQPRSIAPERLAVDAVAVMEQFRINQMLVVDADGKLVELDDAVDCVADVAKDPAGITASSLSFAIPGVEVLKVNGAAPEKAAVQSGAYPLKRPLTLITLQPTGNIQAFFDFMLSPEGQDGLTNLTHPTVPLPSF